MSKVHADTAGTVWKVEVAIGQSVSEGDTLLIIESMKMEIPVCAPSAGVVAELWVTEGEVVADDQVVAILN